MNTINAMKMAFCEEIEVMRSGHSMPYHKLSLIMPITLSDPKRPFGNGAIFDD